MLIRLPRESVSRQREYSALLIRHVAHAKRPKAQRSSNGSANSSRLPGGFRNQILYTLSICIDPFFSTFSLRSLCRFFCLPARFAAFLAAPFFYFEFSCHGLSGGSWLLAQCVYLCLAPGLPIPKLCVYLAPSLCFSTWFLFNKERGRYNCSAQQKQQRQLQE